VRVILRGKKDGRFVRALTFRPHRVGQRRQVPGRGLFARGFCFFVQVRQNGDGSGAGRMGTAVKEARTNAVENTNANIVNKFVVDPGVWGQMSEEIEMKIVGNQLPFTTSLKVRDGCAIQG